MRVMTLILMTVVALLCLAPLGALAQTTDKQPTLEERFLMLDRDRNGRLSLQELRIEEAIFKRLDRNGDGWVTLEEMKRGMGTAEERRQQETIGDTPEQRFHNLDRNRDGRLSPQELGDPALFAKMDFNRDGFITLAETLAYSGKGGAATGVRETSLEQQFRIADRDGDGRLTPQEVNNPTLFAKADLNKDGFVTLAELRQTITPGAQQADPQQPTAEEQRQKNEQKFKEMDRDGDGKLSAAEFPYPDEFNKWDRNGDGFVSWGEIFGEAEPATGGAQEQLSPEQQFKLADKDGDGKLSPAEFPKPDLFAQMDANKDGFVTWEEAKAHLAKTTPGREVTAEQRMKVYDRNGDGKLSKEELGNTDTFQRLDVNNDGFVSLDELRALDKKPEDAAKPRTPEEHFKQADKNGDGKLTPEEVNNPETFKKLDLNGDGIVTLDEMKQAIAQAQPAKETKGAVEGILATKGTNWIEVKAKDGAERYYPIWRAGENGQPGDSDAAMLQTIKELPVGNLVRLTWELREMRRRILTITVIVPEVKEGAVTGTVTAKGLEWIDVAPKDGPTERYTPLWTGGQDGGGFDHAMLARIAAAKVGDSVTIAWKYDERKRLITLEVPAR
ncbi:MAG: transaldolase/EF-hand domain-containing protein [bacterium ADurb.Bin429]|nr:MAG: transaldolase/EF-hand domain-containing protein [bacterium ADurb.Bin429]